MKLWSITAENILEKKCWVQCEVNSSRELSVESNILHKRKLELKHTSFLEGQQIPVIITNKKNSQSKKNVCRGQLRMHKGKIWKHL